MGERRCGCLQSSVCNLLNPTQMAKPDTGYVVENDLDKDAVKWFL